MPKSLVRFLIVFFGVLLTCYFAHTFIISHFDCKSNNKLLMFSYVFNGVFTILLTSVIFIMSQKLKDQLGFIFMGGSLVKIGAFLVILKLRNLGIDKSVFFDFFIPYFLSLILEVYYISKLLNTIK